MKQHEHGESYQDVLTRFHHWLRGNIIRILLATFLFLLALPLAPIVGGVLFPDAPNHDDADLLWENIDTLPSDNMFPLGTTLRSVVKEPTTPGQSITKLIEGEIAWNDTFVRDLLSQNSETCQLLEQAAKKRYFQDPELALVMPEKLNTTGEVEIVWRTGARICALKAIALARNGKGTEGINLALVITRVGQHIIESQGPTGNYLLGSSVRLFGLSALRTIANDTILSARQSLEIERSLGAFATSSQVIRPLKGEYLAQKLAITEIDDGNREKLAQAGLEQYRHFAAIPYYFQPNRTLQEIGDVYRRIIRESSVSCQEYLPYTYRRNLNLPNFAQAYTERNVVGNLIARFVLVPSTPLIERRCADIINLDLTKLVAALRAYKYTNGQYPDSLEALVPRFLSVIPVDPYSGESYRYSKRYGIISSIGVKSEQDKDGNFIHNAKGYEYQLKK